MERIIEMKKVFNEHSYPCPKDYMSRYIYYLYVVLKTRQTLRGREMARLSSTCIYLVEDLKDDTTGVWTAAVETSSWASVDQVIVFFFLLIN